jgi:ribosomal protein L9
MQLGRKISDLEKQTSVQQSAIQKQAVEHQNRERELVEEVSRLQAQMSSEVVVGDGQLFGSVSTEDLFAMKNQLTETERELSDLQSNYDRDKALWEGKVQFLES